MFGVPVSRLAGYAPFLPTPFDERGRVDYAAFSRLCELQVSEHANALIVGDAAGEATSLNLTEFAAIIGIAAHVAEKRVPVIAGLVSNATLKAGETAQCAERSGADALLCGAPYYNKPTQGGVFAHFQWIAESTGLPIFLHDAPAYLAYLHGQIARAQRLFLALSPLAAFLTREGNPAALKAALAVLGLISPALRGPLVSLAADGEIAQILANLRKSHEPYLAAPRGPLTLLQASMR